MKLAKERKKERKILKKYFFREQKKSTGVNDASKTLFIYKFFA